MSANPDSVPEQGEFHSSIPPAKPLTTKGHAPGTKVGNDAVPEFHAQTVPTGTAPKDRVFASQAEDAVEEGDKTKAADTITGADSAEVNAGILK